MKRRGFLKNSGIFILSSGVLPSVLWNVATASQLAPKDKALVVIFQRGAADGLSMVIPIGDKTYGKAIRPTIALTAEQTIKLDELFGLHPSLKKLMPLWDAGNFAVIHQVGMPKMLDSHFDAQDFVELGGAGKKIKTGFLDRLNRRMMEDGETSIYQSIAMQSTLPKAMLGKTGSIAMDSIPANIKDLPSTDKNIKYPKSTLGKHLSEIARLIKGKAGVRIAMTDCGGWDTHENQGGVKGQMADHLTDLGDSIATFMDDLGPLCDRVCVVTMTEFGRTVKENAKGGTDHGHGSVMMLFGNKVKGRQVRARWLSLEDDYLSNGGLPVTTDFRDVMCEIFASHLTIPNPKSIFPNFTPSKKMIGLFGS